MEDAGEQVSFFTITVTAAPAPAPASALVDPTPPYPPTTTIEGDAPPPQEATVIPFSWLDQKNSSFVEALERGLVCGSPLRSPVWTGSQGMLDRTTEGMVARMRDGQKRSGKGAVKLWRRVNPSRSAKHQRMLLSLQAKLPLATHHQILQTILFQDLLTHLALWNASDNRFESHSRQMTRSFSEWLRLADRDPEFEHESAEIAHDVEEFVQELSSFFVPAAAEVGNGPQQAGGGAPATTPTEPSEADAGTAQGTDGMLGADAAAPPAGPEASTSNAPAPNPPPTNTNANQTDNNDPRVRITRREARKLAKSAKKLMARSERFNARWNAHRRSMQAAKDAGTNSVVAFARSASESVGARDRVIDDVLELVILWKNAKTASASSKEVSAGSKEGKDRKGKGKVSALVNLARRGSSA